MIRFIDLGKQIAVDETDPNWPRQFAFYDTVGSKFVRINDDEVFDSLRDLMLAFDLDKTPDPFIVRLLGLMPDWARTVPAPKDTTQIWGTKG